MKIEMCEQMLQSWAQHIKGCQIVQTNWNISPTIDFTAKLKKVEEFIRAIESKLQEKLQKEADEELFNAVRDEFDDGIDYDENEEPVKQKKRKKINIFKSSKPSQFISQCEIDVVGIKINEGTVQEIYFIESAFHKNGLGYHEAVATVLKKILRAMVVAEIVFDDVPVNIVFASPRCRDSVKNTIVEYLEYLDDTMKAYYSPDNTVSLYFNEDFANDIYVPLMEKIDILNNDNDLFMRAMNIQEVADLQSINYKYHFPDYFHDFPNLQD